MFSFVVNANACLFVCVFFKFRFYRYFGEECRSLSSTQFNDRSLPSDSREGKDQNHDGLEEKNKQKSLEEKNEVKSRRGKTVDGRKGKEGETEAHYVTTTVPDQWLSKYRSSGRVVMVPAHHNDPH